ncbi:type II toxin-antitoxin system HicB family antitoxin [Enterobacter hormaechei]|uniref:type II toxin-antitoxin system HicB family antitoxin n=1 Tax=Enterobacter hormaechei TaxID=158836 RepID=UPI001BE0ED02|nr:type II toxin-antitoxin system HicB family antitoxin [Enterobacter hormaechei subsp. xiangfangensis]HAV1851635.1 type II toxin-antitoxin system HicB family antitoxin [Enterobacter hormaechei subsp. xiangfangensis]
MKYPVKLIEAEEGGYVVKFPDVPEALTQADNMQDALNEGLDALVTAFEFYFEDGDRIPSPSKLENYEHFVELPLSVEAKILMLNTFIDSKITQVELANRMNVKKQEVTRLFDLNHSTKIDTIQKAIAAMGHRLNLSYI